MICEICGKRRRIGNRVSHSNIKTKHACLPNVQKVRAVVDGTHRRIQACTRCIRSFRVEKVG
jgi:large subunit ribosomal protein L28